MLPLSLIRGSNQPQNTLQTIMDGGLAVELGPGVNLLIDFDRNDRRPLATVQVNGQFISPQEYLHNVELSQK